MMGHTISQRDNGSRRVQFFSDDPGRTEQAHENDTNINKIMAKYVKTGEFPHTARGPGQYGDFASHADFHAAQNQILDARAQFMSIPAEIRREFDNDPGAFLDFINNPDNDEQAREMGLLEPKPPEPPSAAPPAPAVPAAPKAAVAVPSDPAPTGPAVGVG